MEGRRDEDTVHLRERQQQLLLKRRRLDVAEQASKRRCGTRLRMCMHPLSTIHGSRTADCAIEDYNSRGVFVYFEDMKELERIDIGGD